MLRNILPAIILTFAGCADDRLDIPMPEEKVDLSIKRLEQDMFAIPPQAVDSAAIEVLTDDYGRFFSQVVTGILGLGRVTDPGFQFSLSSFLSDVDMSAVYKDIQKEFPDVNFIEEDLERSFSYYHYYFPDSIIPEIVTLHTGFNYALVATDSVLGVGLEMFLGEKYPYYDMLGYPQYKKRTMNREYMHAQIMKGWISSSVTPDLTGSTLLDNMIHQGRLHYLTKATMPEVEDKVLFGITQEQADWLESNENQMWAYIIDREILYSTSVEEINKMTGEGPFTPGMADASPGGAGRYTGYMIVKSYMDKHQDVTLTELMQTEPMEILKRSSYRP